MRTRYLLLVLFAAGALSACGGDASSGMGGRPVSGNLGQVYASPECGALNQACLRQGLDAPIALGSTTELTIEYRLLGSSGPPTTLEAVHPEVLTAEGTTVEAVGAGASGLLFLGPDGRVVDFLHLWVHAAEELRVLRYSPNGELMGRVQDEITLLVGDELLLSVEPYATSQALLGNFTLERELSGDAVALVPDPVGGWYRLVARREGSASVTFTALGLNKALSVEVQP